MEVKMSLPVGNNSKLPLYNSSNSNVSIANNKRKLPELLPGLPELFPRLPELLPLNPLEILNPRLSPSNSLKMSPYHFSAKAISNESKNLSSRNKKQKLPPTNKYPTAGP